MRLVGYPQQRRTGSVQVSWYDKDMPGTGSSGAGKYLYLGADEFPTWEAACGEVVRRTGRVPKGHRSDACDYKNGRRVPPHPLKVPIPVHDRNDARDQGPAPHDRSASTTKGTHRAEMNALGLVDQEIEFATSSDSSKKILGDIMQEAKRVRRRIRKDGTIKRGRVVVCTKVHPARDRRVDADVVMLADDLMVDVEVMRLPPDVGASA